jgi:UBX domain-containing protein 1
MTHLMHSIFCLLLSGLAVQPNYDDTTQDPSILSTIRAAATHATNDGSSPDSSSRPPSRTITLYRSGFTVDNGPLRRLDDPANGEFLRDLAKGIVPKELQRDASAEELTVGLIDKRHLEYDQDVSSAGVSGSTTTTTSFVGEGQSLGRASRVHAQGGIISPPTCSDTTVEVPVPVKEDEPTTVIQVRLLNGKRLRVRINTSATIEDLVQHIHASGDAGSEDYVLSAGFPPKVLEDLSLTIEESGLKGAQVIQNKAV